MHVRVPVCARLNRKRLVLVHAGGQVGVRRGVRGRQCVGAVAQECVKAGKK